MTKARLWRLIAVALVLLAMSRVADADAEMTASMQQLRGSARTNIDDSTTAIKTLTPKRRLYYGGPIIDVGAVWPLPTSSTASSSSHSIARTSSTGETSTIIPDHITVKEMTGNSFVGPKVMVDVSSSDNDSMIHSDDDNGSDNDIESTQITDRIIGGSDATPHPFHTLILTNFGGGYRSAGCGGTLISNCHVLTAAHCFATRQSSTGLAVYVNAYKPYQGNGGEPFHFSQVKTIIKHSEFNDTTNENDIAVLKLAQCLDTTTFPPAVPANEPPEENMLVSIMGFGKMSEQQNTLLQTVEALQIAQIPVIARDTCQNEYYGNRIQSDMICGGFAGGGVDACQGDSGSGMTRVGEDGTTYIFGIVSWGVGCGRPGNPGVYASVAYHFDWLVNHICDGPDLDSNAASWCFESAQNSGRTSATISNNATALTNTNYTFSANDDESSFNETTTPATTPIPTLSASTITPTIEPSDLFTGIPSSNPSHQPSLPPSPSPKDNNSNEKGANKNNNRSEEDRLFYSTAALPQIHLERTTTSANIRRNGGGGTIGISSSGIHPNESTEAVTTTATTRLGRARGVRKKDWNNHHSRKQRHKGNVRGSHRLL